MDADQDPRDAELPRRERPRHVGCLRTRWGHTEEYRTAVPTQHPGHQQRAGAGADYLSTSHKLPTWRFYARGSRQSTWVRGLPGQ